MLKLGTPVKDKSTGQFGMLTLMQIELDDTEIYYFQPKGLNPKTGEPLEGRWVVDAAIEDGVELVGPEELPFEILGSVATDNASGYKGTITNMRVHINGCVHANVQSSQILEETGSVPVSVDFDIRRLSGDKIPLIESDEELLESQKIHPSPVSDKGYVPNFPLKIKNFR